MFSPLNLILYLYYTELGVCVGLCSLCTIRGKVGQNRLVCCYQKPEIPISLLKTNHPNLTNITVLSCAFFAVSYWYCWYIGMLLIFVCWYCIQRPCWILFSFHCSYILLNFLCWQSLYLYIMRGVFFLFLPSSCISCLILTSFCIG